MGNLGYFKVDTNNEYVKLDTLTELTFSEGTTYTMQAENAGGRLVVCMSSTAPTEGGFVIQNLEKFSYTPTSGEDIYVRTGSYGAVYLNIAS